MSLRHRVTRIKPARRGLIPGFPCLGLLWKVFKPVLDKPAIQDFMPEKKRTKSLYRVVTEDLESDGFERCESRKFIEFGKHYIPYVRELDGDKTLTVAVAKRESLYVLVTFLSIGQPEEINEDDDWENWKTRNREIFLKEDDISLNASSIRVATAPAPARLAEPEHRQKPAKMPRLASPVAQGNETENEDDEAGASMPQPAAAGPVVPEWRRSGPPPDAVRKPATPVQVKAEYPPIAQILSVVQAADMMNAEAQAVPLVANAETQHVQVLVDTGIQLVPIMISVGVQTDAQIDIPPAGAQASAARPAAAKPANDVIDLSLDD